jgi:hypothetical protein
MTQCPRCDGTGGVSRWERLPIKPEFANGFAVAMDFHEHCPECRGTGLIDGEAPPATHKTDSDGFGYVEPPWRK